MDPVDTGQMVAAVLEIRWNGRRVRFDEGVYASATPIEKRAMEAVLQRVLSDICLTAPAPVLYAVMATVADGWSMLRHTAAVAIMKALLSGDPRVSGKSRLALLFLILGFSDLNRAEDSVFHRFVLCLAGVRTKSIDSDDRGAGVLPLALQRLLRNRSLTGLLTPAIMALIAAFFRMASLEAELIVRVRHLRTLGGPGYRDLSWKLAIRLGLWLSAGPDDSQSIRQELSRFVIADGLARAHRDGDVVRTLLVERAAQWSPDRFPNIAMQAAFEIDPAGFDRRYSRTPYLFRRVQLPEGTEIILDSDGSEVFGYRRDGITGAVVAVERDRLTAPLRGSRNRRRWNSEPVRRARIADAVVSPNGLVLFGGDSILDFEFANVPNRSGSAIDPHHLGHYPELVLSNDQSSVLRPFPLQTLDRAALLSGLSNMGNFGHFIFNGVSKFPLLREQLGDGWSVVVPGARARFHDAIIGYCGLDPARFVFTESSHGIHSGVLDVFSEAPMGKWPYNLLDRLRSELPRRRSAEGARFIYLARPGNARRNLGNEAALIDMLEGFGFEPVRPELLPFAEQVAALEAAEVIVAPHGSALATLVFCHGVKRVVEIETKTSYQLALYNFLGHQALRVHSRAGAAPVGALLDHLTFNVDLDAARSAVAWAVGE